MAKERGILLYELQEPGKETDQSDRIKSFGINISEYTPIFNNIKIIQDTEWNVQELKRLNIPISEASKIKIEISDSLKFYDEEDLESTNALKLFNSLVPTGFNELPPTKIAYTFDKPTFIKIQNPPLKIKIHSIEFMVSKILTTKRILLKGENFVEYVLKNVTDGTVSHPRAGFGGAKIMSESDTTPEIRIQPITATLELPPAITECQWLCKTVQLWRNKIDHLS